MDETFICPACGSSRVVVTEEQMFLVNTLEHYCHSVKAQDADAKTKCLDCQWQGTRATLDTARRK